MADVLTVAVALCGAVAVVAGVAMIYVPAGVIVGGLVALLAAAGWARAPE